MSAHTYDAKKEQKLVEFFNTAADRAQKDKIPDDCRRSYIVHACEIVDNLVQVRSMSARTQNVPSAPLSEIDYAAVEAKLEGLFDYASHKADTEGLDWAYRIEYRKIASIVYRTLATVKNQRQVEEDALAAPRLKGRVL